jgi:hypothetical protein
MVIGLVAALGFGGAAALIPRPRTAYICSAIAGLVGAYAAAASLVAPSATAGTLFGLSCVAAVIAIVAATAAGETAQSHRWVVGGSAVTAGIISFAGAAAALAATFTARVDVPVNAAFAGAAAALAVAGLACRRTTAYLPYVTAGVAGAATVAALASLATPLPAGVYGAAAALLGVLAELLRIRSDPPRQTWQPADGWRPDRTALPMRNWQPVRREGGFGMGVAAASGVSAAVAIIYVTPPIAAALLGPYRWVTRVWTGTPTTAGSLGSFDHWVGTPAHAATAAVLTITAALAAVGLGGGRDAVTDRAVATIIPGAAITLLITPGALGAPWPVPTIAALAVGVLAGEALALTPPPSDAGEGYILRVARRVVFVIGLLAANAGLAGSLATRSTTITTLAFSVFFALIAALGGRTAFARLFAWNVVSGSLIGLALAIGLAAGLPTRETAFGVLVASTGLLGLAAALPRIRRGDRHDRGDSLGLELVTLEGGGYLGLVVAIGLTVGWPQNTAAVSMAAGTILSVAAIRPGRNDSYRSALIIVASILQVVAIWILLRVTEVGTPEAYTLPFAGLALVIGLIELRRRPTLGSWVAYGPALVAAFAPTLVIVLVSDGGPARRILLIVVAVLTVAIGAITQQQAPVVVGGVVTTVATLHELFLLGRLMPWWVPLLLFTAAGALLISLGATYERRRAMRRLRGAIRQMR